MREHPQDQDDFVADEEPDETTFAQGRMVGRTYASRSFPLPRPGSADDAEPSKFICKVFDPKVNPRFSVKGKSAAQQ
ncbi:MAG: hypothetical protein M3P11_13170 [Actinomycetota bacterium]|nr:hypothetical protein [Actinomycetota bacterium]